MKIAAVILVTLVALSNATGAPARIEKSALLVLPAAISIGDDLLAMVAFRWDEAMPVVLDTWSFHGRLSTYGELKVFDESGKEVPILHPLTMPHVPSGKKEVRTGEVLKIALYKLGWIQFSHPGTYYAVATFQSAFAGGTNVRFTSRKRWFQVTDAKPKKA